MALVNHYAPVTFGKIPSLEVSLWNNYGCNFKGSNADEPLNGLAETEKL